ncbi:CesT family type III secretion system chaperone [Pseudomonas indica]|uniref:CesT family type III secretion system chaperone n=1 Tax=Pseudomonas indica TaxID=137658 RepID=UPI003FD561ED
MYPQDARAWLTEAFSRGRTGLGNTLVFDAQGQAVVHAPEGVSCLLWIPDQDARWHLYASLREVDPRSDGHFLAMALALNLQSVLMQDTHIGLNPETRQLLLHRVVVIDMATLDAPATLRHFIGRCVYLREELGKALVSAGRPSRAETPAAFHSSFSFHQRFA